MKYIYVVLVAICFLVYLNALTTAFISDDIPTIIENPQISKLSQFLIGPSTLLNSLAYYIGNYQPFMYHLISVILHCVNTILVFLFLRLFFKTESSFLGSLVFAVHPIHVEAVTWISGKPYLLLALFTLLTYLFYHRATYAQLQNKKINFIWYIICLVLFTYFISSHFTFFLVAPFLLVASDITFDRWRKNWKWWLPFLGILVIRVILAHSIILNRISNMHDELGSAFTLKNPLVYFVNSFYTHLGLLLWPAKLTFCHTLRIIQKPWYTYLVFLIPIIGLLFFAFKKAKVLFFAISIFIIFLSLTYSPIPMTSVAIAERYVYFPSIALSMLAAFGYEHSPKKLRPYLTVALILIIVAYGIRTIVRNEDWRTPEKFWQQTIRVSSRNPDAYTNLGLVYFEAGKIKEAISEYEKALALYPLSFKAHNNLGVAYGKLGDKERAISCFKKAVEINPKLFDAYNNLANLYSDAGKTEEAIALYKKAIAINPRYANVYYNLGNLYLKLGKTKEAAALYQKTSEINPDFVDAYNNLANLYSDAGKTEEAVALYKKAIAINPYYINAYYNLANLYSNLGNNKEAINAYQKVIEINPNHAPAHFNLSVAYFSEQRYELAVKHSNMAAELGYYIPPEFLKLLEPHRK